MSVYNNDYIRRLLIEAPYIRARLENPGGSVILTGVAADTERVNNDYSTQIGSGFHLDLIEAELAVQEELNDDQKQALLLWAAGVSSKEAALYANAQPHLLRKRRERGVSVLAERMNHGEQNAGRTSGSDSSDSSPQES